MIRKWIEAMRPRTLPVSVSGVIAGTACAVIEGYFSLIPAVLCLLFAMLAQIASNFGNEYFDYKNGIDRKGRDGFRRGVTEGDISPKAMKYATFGTLAIAAAVGCTMLFYADWWIIPIGIAIGIFALAYSAGPYPLSHHGLGDVAVIVFFGVAPVTLTCYLQQGSWESIATSLPTSIAIGLLAANVLIVNNYRDMDDDRAVNKNTTVVIFGRNRMRWCYLLSGITGMAVMFPVWRILPLYCMAVPLLYLGFHINTWRKISSSQGAALNPLLGETARNLLIFTLLFLAAAIICQSF